MVGDAGVVLKTVNGGANWVRAEVPDLAQDTNLYGVHVFRPLIVHVCLSFRTDISDLEPATLDLPSLVFVTTWIAGGWRGRIGDGN